MAIWQFDLYLITRSESPPDLGAEDWAPSLSYSVVYDIQEELARYLGPPWFMLTDWLVFGPERGNRVDVTFENEHDANVFVRCDVRDEAPQFLVLISNLAHFYDCRFFNPQSRQLVQPNLEKLGSAIRRSRAQLPRQDPDTR